MTEPSSFADLNPYKSPIETGPDADIGAQPVEIIEDATGGLIPYDNPHALGAYYLGIFGMCPVIGIFASLPAFVLGIIGLRRFAKNPAIRGSVHSWIGIVLGLVCSLLNLACWGTVVLDVAIGLR